MVNIPLTAAAPHVHVLPVTLITQNPFKYLCWAACSAMVLTAQAPQTPATTADVAKRVQAAGLGGRCALGGETDGQASFDQTCWPDCAVHDVLGLSCRLLDGFLGEADLMTEVGTNRRPVIVYIEWSNGGGSHVVLVVGYTSAGDGSVLFEICDPRAEASYPLSHDALLNFESAGSWCKTYTMIGVPL